MVDWTAMIVQLENTRCLAVVNASAVPHIHTSMESRSAFHVPRASTKAVRAQNLVVFAPVTPLVCQVAAVNPALLARDLRKATPIVPRLVF